MLQLGLQVLVVLVPFSIIDDQFLAQLLPFAGEQRLHVLAGEHDRWIGISLRHAVRSETAIS